MTTKQSNRSDCFAPSFDGARNDRGVVLLTVLILLLTVSLIGATLAELFASVDLSARSIEEETKALYLAEAGIAQGVHVLKGQGSQGVPVGVVQEQVIGPVSLGDGTYTARINFTQSLLTSTGQVKGTKKTVQLQYQAF